MVGALIARGRADLDDRIVLRLQLLLVLRKEGEVAHVVQDNGVVHAALEGAQESRELRSIGEQAARVFPIYLAPPGKKWAVPHTTSLGPLSRRTSHTRVPHLPSSTREPMGRYSHDLAWAAQSENKPHAFSPST